MFFYYTFTPIVVARKQSTYGVDRPYSQNPTLVNPMVVTVDILMIRFNNCRQITNLRPSTRKSVQR